MKAFWTIRPNVGGKPDLPSLPDMRIAQNTLDIWILPAGAGAANHIHTIIGGMSMPSFQVTSRHTHFYLYQLGSVIQRFFFHETESAHTHPDPVRAYFMCFIICSDAAFTTITAAPYNVKVIAQAVIATTEDGDKPTVNLDQSLWSGPERTFWANQALNNMGISLPASIDRGSRLVAMLSQMFRARYGEEESNLRM